MKKITVSLGSDKSLDNKRALRAIGELEEAINSAIDCAKDLKRAAPELRGVLDSYTIGWLQSFIDGVHQQGSIVDLRKRMNLDD